MYIRKQLVGVVATVILIAGCGTAAPAATAVPVETTPTAAMEKEATATADTMPNNPTPTAAMAQETPVPATEMAMETPTAVMEEKESPEAMPVPPWMNAKLINVRSNESFKFTDFKGKVVLVETMAIWCSNCLRQQKEVKALHDALGDRDDFVSVGLGIDPNEPGARLNDYIEKNGFDWTYAVSPVDVSRELGNTYGDQFLNPPSTPMLIIDRDGSVHLLPFGIKSAQALQEALQPFLN